MVFARNTVNYRCVDDFTIFLLSTNVFITDIKNLTFVCQSERFESSSVDILRPKSPQKVVFEGCI